MIEIIASLIFLAYCIAGIVYCVRMENDKVLRQVHRVTSDHDWSERCFALGFIWPIAPVINFIVRRRNDPKRIRDQFKNIG